MKCNMGVDYNAYAKTFAKSRKNMKWAELEYFFSKIKKGSILDVGCGSGRFLQQHDTYFKTLPESYVGVDLSQGLLDEAKKDFPEQIFRQGNMLDIENICTGKAFQNIFLIASFHHLNSLSERKELLLSLYNILPKGGCIYMTNWALDSQLNTQKYESSRIDKSENKYGGTDYNIKIGDSDRYYHCFSVDELEYLSEKSGFTILENRLFQGERNYITILQK